MKPLGLLYIATFLEKFGYTVSLIDCLDRHHPALPSQWRAREGKDRKFGCGKFYFQPLDKPACLGDILRQYKRYGISLSAFEEELKKVPAPEVIGVTSGMTYWYPGPFEVIRLVKSYFPRVPVVLGGIYATLCPDHARNFSGADLVIEGAGEIQMLKIADGIAGIKRNYSKIDFHPEDLIYPAYHLLRETRAVAMLTSRGCPLKCTYCASSILQPSFRQRKPSAVIKEIEYYQKRLGAVDIAFYDDALLLNLRQHFLPILESLQGLEGLRLHTPNGLHLRYIGGKVAGMLRQANFRTLRLSFESINPARQRDSSFKVNCEDLIRAVKNLKQAGYCSPEIEVYVMMGLPGQSFEEVEASIRFVHQAGAKVKLVEFSPVPGTQEFKKALLVNSHLADEPLLHNNTILATSQEIDFPEMEKLKTLTRELNSSLDSL